MALNPQNDREWIASQHAIAAARKDAPVPLALTTGSDARSLAIELAKLIEKQDDDCEYRHVPTERLEALLEKFLTERVLAHPNV